MLNADPLSPYTRRILGDTTVALTLRVYALTDNAQENRTINHPNEWPMEIAVEENQPSGDKT